MYSSPGNSIDQTRGYQMCCLLRNRRGITRRFREQNRSGLISVCREITLARQHQSYGWMYRGLDRPKVGCCLTEKERLTETTTGSQL